MQHVTVKSTHFAAWMGHFVLTVFGGTATGCLLGLLLQMAMGDSGDVDIGICGLIGTGVYLVGFLIYVFVRAALGYKHY